MNKNLSIALGLSLLLGIGAGGYYYWTIHSKPAKAGENFEVGSEQTTYKVTVDSIYSTAQRDDVILNLDGSLVVHPQGDDQLVSEWTSFDRLVAMNNTVSPEIILNSPTVTAIDAGEMKHFVDANFPRDYSGFQKELLSRIFIPVPVRVSPEIYRSEREGKNLFRVKYTIAENKEGFEANRSWIQNLQGDVQTDPKLNGFRYQYTSEGRLVSMQGTLVFKGIDHENLPFSLTTKIFVNATNTSSLSASKRVYRDRKSMVVAEAPRAVRSSGDPLRPLKEVFADLDRLSGTDEPQVRADLYIEMSKILEENPASISEFKEKILSMTAETGQDQFQQGVLFSVLSGSETLEGSNVLADLFAGDCKTEFCREMAISAYGMHSNMSLDSAQKVLEVARSDSSAEMSLNAYLGAGAAGRILGDRFEELKPSLISAVKAADEAKDFTSKAVIVRAIGNTGDRGLLPVIQEGLKSEDELTKNMSFFALRFMPGDDVNEILVNSLKSEKDELTATEIVRSASLRQFSKTDYEKISEKIPEWGEQDADLAVNTVNILLTAYQRNPEDAEEALLSLKAKVVPELKQFIEEGMNPYGPTPNDEGNKDPEVSLEDANPDSDSDSEASESNDSTEESSAE